MRSSQKRRRLRQQHPVRQQRRRRAGSGRRRPSCIPTSASRHAHELSKGHGGRERCRPVSPRWRRLTLLFAMPAAAVDGEILINQAKVIAGGITPGDPRASRRRSAGRPLQAHRQSHRAGGQERHRGHADDVTLDLNGFTISSSPPGEAPYGVGRDDVRRLRIDQRDDHRIPRLRHLQSRGARGASRTCGSSQMGSASPSRREGRVRNSTVANGHTASAFLRRRA